MSKCPFPSIPSIPLHSSYDCWGVKNFLETSVLFVLLCSACTEMFHTQLVVSLKLYKQSAMRSQGSCEISSTRKPTSKQTQKKENHFRLGETTLAAPLRHKINSLILFFCWIKSGSILIEKRCIEKRTVSSHEEYAASTNPFVRFIYLVVNCHKHRFSCSTSTDLPTHQWSIVFTDYTVLFWHRDKQRLSRTGNYLSRNAHSLCLST